MKEVEKHTAIFHRKSLLLSLLEAFGGELSAKKFQKLLFLYIKSMNEEIPAYDFAPYKYGCFSFKANMDMISMRNKGLISIENKEGFECKYQLIEKGHFSDLNIFELKHLDLLKDKFKDYSKDEIIRYVYTHYPFFAVRSTIAEKLLTKEELEKVNEIKTKLAKDEPILFTIGYEGLSLEQYIKRLINQDVKVLVDVRKNAYSQKYGFSKGILSKACEAVKIHYIHIPQLGIESEERQELNTQKDYDRLFDKYEKTVLIENHNYLLQLRKIVDDGVRVALTCFEKQSIQCHRSRVAKHLMAMPERKYELINL